MFSLLTWYEYNFNKTLDALTTVNDVMVTYNVANCIQDYIIGYIACPHCATMYDDDCECYCWFTIFYYAQIIIIPEGKDVEEFLENLEMEEQQKLISV